MEWNEEERGEPADERASGGEREGKKETRI